MKRIIDKNLQDWKDDKYRKPILLRGARQIGKTYAIRQLAKSFDSFVEINFELDPEIKNIFEKNLDPERIILELSLKTDKKIIPGKTLLFFDEIQSTPNALTSLRYFYEQMPDLHVIAAGSLIDFSIQKVGIPVGRVSSLYMYPMSFFEFLYACDYEQIAQTYFFEISKDAKLSDVVHKKLLHILAEYLAIGGMPEAVIRWKETHDPMECFKVHHSLIDTYRQDFEKYAETFRLKYVEKIFSSISKQLGKKFKFSEVEGGYRKRELSPSLDLLVTAGVVHEVLRTAGNGVPLGAEVDIEDFKIVFLDVALSQAMLGLDLKGWFLNPEQEFVNKGALVEAFIGQEMLAYSNPLRQAKLFYWRRNKVGSEAEIDYLMSDKDKVIPIEVKSGSGSTLKSMNMFLEKHKKSPYGIRFSTQNYSFYNKVYSYPLYAVYKVI